MGGFVSLFSVLGSDRFGLNWMRHGGMLVQEKCSHLVNAQSLPYETLSGLGVGSRLGEV